MKKAFFLGICLAVILLFITSCVPTPPTTYYVCPDGSKVLNPANCRLAEEEAEKEEEELEPTPEAEEEEEEFYEIIIDEKAQELFAKINKANNVQFSYVESPRVLPENTYYATRTKMKVALETKVRFSKEDSFDTVYLDLVELTAVAYCESRDKELCPDRDKAYRVAFDDYYVETPFEWLAKITKANLTGKSQSIEGRNAIEVMFEVKGEPGVMFVDSYFGVPLEVTFKGKKYEFRDIVINEVKSQDLEHQFGE
ncbi:hypothetical protein AYK26_06315 [Euryarchaeota archaeon SM23-78]|nr:MAG: hypothetical protein AYK26_06315 [Euryarchaeota archaeon SM23-78]MBW3001049.1 hypothetical protein [Candidatus Woesearchaeota archaeon]